MLDARWTLLVEPSDRLAASRREWIEVPSGDAADLAKRVTALREAVAKLAGRIGDAIAAATSGETDPPTRCFGYRIRRYILPYAGTPSAKWLLRPAEIRRFLCRGLDGAPRFARPAPEGDREAQGIQRHGSGHQGASGGWHWPVDDRSTAWRRQWYNGAGAAGTGRVAIIERLSPPSERSAL